MITTLLPSKEEVFEAASKLLEGRPDRFVIVAHDARRALLGVSVCPGTEDGDDTTLFWPRFGIALEPEIQQVSAERLFEVIRDFKVESCDDVRRLRIGFVTYDVLTRTSCVHECSLSEIKGANLTQRQRDFLRAPVSRMSVGEVGPILEDLESEVQAKWPSNVFVPSSDEAG